MRYTRKCILIITITEINLIIDFLNVFSFLRHNLKKKLNSYPHDKLECLATEKRSIKLI